MKFPEIPRQWTISATLTFIISVITGITVYFRDVCPECMIVNSVFILVLIGSAITNYMPRLASSRINVEGINNGETPEIGQRQATFPEAKNFEMVLLTFVGAGVVMIGCVYFCYANPDYECLANPSRKKTMLLISVVALMLIGMPTAKRLLLGR